MTAGAFTAGPGCPLPLTPLCDVAGSAGGGIASDILSTIVGWVVAAADWLLGQIGAALAASTPVNVGASWFEAHYAVMGAIAAVIAVPLLVVAAVQAVWRQSPAVLVRAAFVQLPLAGLLSAMAVQVVQLSLSATDALCAAVSAGSAAGVTRALGAVATDLLAQQDGLSPVPAFAVGLGALLVVAGAVVLWLELVVRAGAVYVAVLFLPLALASLVSPGVAHWCRRLLETIAALVLSKFVIVAVLSLAVGAVSSGTGFATVLSGAALLLLAAFTPFTLLRLVPVVEAGAALSLEGARHRVRQAGGRAPASAASFALNKVRDQALVGAVPGVVGILGPGVGVPGSPNGSGTGGSGAAGDSASSAGGGANAAQDGGLDAAHPGARRRGGRAPSPPGPLVPGGAPGPMWRGDPGSERALQDVGDSAAAASRDALPDALGGVVPGVEMPLWGGNLPGSRTPSAPDGRSVAPEGRHELGHDALGPVLRWVPGAGAPGAGGADPRRLGTGDPGAGGPDG